MSSFDTVSTVVERIHLTEDLEKMATEIGLWINDGANIQSSILTPDEVEQLTTTIDNGQRVRLSKPEIIFKLNKLRSQLSQIPIIEVVCPFEADQNFKYLLIKNLQAAIQGPFVAKISTNNDLIAGAQIIFKGKFRDYSLLKKMEDNKETIFGTVLKEFNG